MSPLSAGGDRQTDDGQRQDGIATHWDDVYRSKPVDEVSWFQAVPATSRRLVIGALASGDAQRPASRRASVIDVGAGASTLVDLLIDAGVGDVSVLDASSAAMSVTRERLARRPDRNASVATIVADLMTWSPARRWDVWHDRAVFHFLTDEADRQTYVDLAARSVRPGGAVVIGVFALDGPQQCSGLTTQRYDTAGLAAAFGPSFQLEHTEAEVHRTPAGSAQAFVWAVLRRLRLPSDA